MSSLGLFDIWKDDRLLVLTLFLLAHLLDLAGATHFHNRYNFLPLYFSRGSSRKWELWHYPWPLDSLLGCTHARGWERRRIPTEKKAADILTTTFGKPLTSQGHRSDSQLWHSSSCKMKVLMVLTDTSSLQLHPGMDKMYRQTGCRQSSYAWNGGSHTIALLLKTQGYACLFSLIADSKLPPPEFHQQLPTPTFMIQWHLPDVPFKTGLQQWWWP